MKKLYIKISGGILVILLAMLTFTTAAQDAVTTTPAGTNAAPSYNYWSVGLFGGVMQFNGDLSKNLWINLYPNSIGYNVGIVGTKQFTRVIGVRARIAYGMVQSRVENKFTWDFNGGNGTPAHISQSFKSDIIETDLQVTLNWLNWALGYKPSRLFSSYLIAGVGVDQSFGTKRDLTLDKDVAYIGRNGNGLNVGNTNGIGHSDLNLKVDAGIGFDFNINRHFSIPVEFSWRWQQSDLLDMTRGGSQKMVNDMYSSATIGLTYKFAYKVEKVKKVEVVPIAAAVVAAEPGFRFRVTAPANIPAEYRVRELFPVRNYIFFDQGSNEIPARYVILSKDQVKDYKEDHLDLFPPKNLSGRSSRQMIVYYNILNILGDRMQKNPATTVRLTGASMEGPEGGMAMAGSVKLYLVNIFGIDGARITTEGRIKPRIASEQPGGTKELELLREGDRRVSIWSTSPELLMEFQSGPDAPLRPVEIFGMQNAPPDSYVTFNVDGAHAAFTSWSLGIRDKSGMVQSFGPFTHETVSMPGKSILGDKPEGVYHITMTGQTRSGHTVTRDTTLNMVLWTPSKDVQLTRFSIIYEFNESKAVTIYKKYLTDIVIPKIPVNGTVIIHGYTDIIGDESYNQKLSLARANDVRTILENGLSKAGRGDVKFEVYGFGEDEALSPFENKFPEERFYNRTVIIDIIPAR
ncbi:MAG: OmpA family protein [Bacteroidota bacterium]